MTGINDTRVLDTPVQRPQDRLDDMNDGTAAEADNNNDNNADGNENNDNNHLHQDWSKVGSSTLRNEDMADVINHARFGTNFMQDVYFW